MIDKPLEEEILQILNPYGDDKLSKMNKKELKEFLYCLKKCFLVLRDDINLDSQTTFGLELEFEKSKNRKIQKLLRKTGLSESWCLKNDPSLISGGEINSPILTDNKRSWEELDEVCSIIRENAIIGENSGGHIHIGTHVLGPEKQSWLNFLKLWAVYENIIFKFTYGDKAAPRTSILKYAAPFGESILREISVLEKKLLFEEHDIKRLNIIIAGVGRSTAINFSNVSDFSKKAVSNTIEFRCPNGTLDPQIWQNNVNLLVNLLKYSKSLAYDDDIIERRKYENKKIFDSIHGYRKVYIQQILELYSEIYLEQALELSDLLYDKNIDKIYFLKQYLNPLKETSKIFTKRKS